jgi:hypothetical protein
MVTTPTDRRRLPLLYYGLAHLALLAVCALLALVPRSIAGFYYHPKMVAMVHLVTLGWIGASILGSLYMLGPMTLGLLRRRGRVDTWVFWIFATGVLGMTTHFWIDEPRGMVWGAGLVLVAFGWVGGRVLLGLPAARLPGGVKLHLALAFANLALAGGLGVLAGLDKFLPVLPGRTLSNVYAHAHLAALGWVLMLVMGVGYRLLPMLLPAAPPRDRWVGASAVTLEVGVLGLAAGLLGRGEWSLPFGALALGAAAILVTRFLWMLRHRRPPGPGLPRPDPAIGLIGAAFASLVAAALLGGLLLLAPAGEWKLAAATAYGLLGLLGFFGQLVAGAGLRLVPLWAYLGSAVTGATRLSPPPRELAARGLERWICRLWWPAVPALAVGLALEWIPLVRLGALTLAVAILLGLAAHATAWRRSA